MRSQKARQFWAAFFLGLFCFSLPFGAALIRFGKKRPEPSVSQIVLPETGDRFSMAIGWMQEGVAQQLVLLRFDPAAAQIDAVLLPGEVQVEDAGRRQALCSVWRTEGAQRAVDALARTYPLSCDRWVSLDPAVTKELFDRMGMVDFTLEAPILLSDGLPLLSQGRQLFDGNRLMQLLLYPTEEAAAVRMLRSSKAIEALLSQRLTLLNLPQLEQLFLLLVNDGDSNLTAEDFETHRSSLYYLFSHPYTIRMHLIEGQWIDDEFVPSEQSISIFDAFN